MLARPPRPPSPGVPAPPSVTPTRSPSSPARRALLALPAGRGGVRPAPPRPAPPAAPLAEPPHPTVHHLLPPAALARLLASPALLAWPLAPHHAPHDRLACPASPSAPAHHKPRAPLRFARPCDHLLSRGDAQQLPSACAVVESEEGGGCHLLGPFPPPHSPRGSAPFAAAWQGGGKPMGGTYGG